MQCWHGGLRTIGQLNSSVDMLILEFLQSSDFAEAERSLHELNAKYYHHEFVRRCVDAAYAEPKKQEAIIALLQHMSHSGAPRQACLRHDQNGGFLC
jgi:hypothetical protein